MRNECERALGTVQGLRRLCERGVCTLQNVCKVLAPQLKPARPQPLEDRTDGQRSQWPRLRENAGTPRIVVRQVDRRLGSRLGLLVRRAPPPAPHGSRASGEEATGRRRSRPRRQRRARRRAHTAPRRSSTSSFFRARMGAARVARSNLRSSGARGAPTARGPQRLPRVGGCLARNAPSRPRCAAVPALP